MFLNDNKVLQSLIFQCLQPIRAIKPHYIGGIVYIDNRFHLADGEGSTSIPTLNLKYEIDCIKM